MAIGRPIWIFLRATSVVLALVYVALAGPLEEAGVAFDRGDYRAALQLFRPLAERGDAVAQFALGILHYKGYGVSEDGAAAARWFRLAAEQGYATPQFYLGAMYVAGSGVLQDYGEAARWYQRAAERGHAWAQVALGFFFANGRGVPKDHVQAHMWFNLAASRFSVDKKSRFSTDPLLRVNEKDLQEAREAARGARDTIALEMTAAQVADAQKLAREWKPKPEQ